jgi:hypothetical protein
MNPPDPKPARKAPAARLTSIALAPRPPAAEMPALAPLALPPPVEAAPPAAPEPAAAEIAAPAPAGLTPAASTLAASVPTIARSPRRSADDLVAYWDGLKRIGNVPEFGDLDQGAVAASWRNSFLLSFGASDPGGKITRLGEITQDIEYTPMVIDWILSLGRRVAAARTAVQEVQSFPLSFGMALCRSILLPLGSRDGKVTHVLCQLSRAEDARAERRA